MFLKTRAQFLLVWPRHVRPIFDHYDVIGWNIPKSCGIR